MLRGHQNGRGYYTGKGTEYPARRYLAAGWAVAAPDFLGFAQSSPAPAPPEAHQLYSAINAIDLYRSLQKPDVRYAADIAEGERIVPNSFGKIVLWGHSNGGQAALHLLEALGEPVAAVLWAPVSLPWPDSVSHYARNSLWADRFKENYDAADYSLFSFLGSIAPGTSILLEQGDRDRGVPKEWNDALAAHLRAENEKRPAAEKFNFEYQVWKGANHNLEPYWDQVLPGDIRFWENN
jgi:pimeloyl-ACP methyl ester carboxylesterase